MRLLLRILLTLGLVWLLANLLPNLFALSGDWRAVVLVGLALALLNFLVRPLLHIVLLPLTFLLGFIGTMILNAIILWLLVQLVAHLDPSIVTLTIGGGVLGWLVVAVVLGLGSWIVDRV